MKLPGPASGRFVHNASGKASTCQTAKIITLLTDFGLKDPYAGIMKGVIHAITGTHACLPQRQRRWVAPITGKAAPASRYPAAPSNPSLSLSDHDVTIIDITHDVEPQDIREAAFLIEEYYRFFPANTVHVAIVDPTVGSARRSIILSKEHYLFVGPDNGIFTLIMGDDPEVYLIEAPSFMLKDISSTFHGRDIFAPAAAYLSKGVQPSVFGERITDPVRLQNVLPRVERDTLKGEVVRFDRFGNAITNIKIDYLTDFLHGRSFKVHIAGIAFTAINRSYYEDEFTCLIGSSGYLEFGFFKGSFAEMTRVGKSEQVTVEC
jgi:S-adenosylmethionine hydrolase